MKIIPKRFLMFLNPMIVFVCGNHQENKNVSTFSFIKIGNTCFKIETSALRLVKLPPIYIFQIYPKSNFIIVFERFECICKAKYIKK